MDFRVGVEGDETSGIVLWYLRYTSGAKYGMVSLLPFVSLKNAYKYIF